MNKLVAFSICAVLSANCSDQAGPSNLGRDNTQIEILDIATPAIRCSPEGWREYELEGQEALERVVLEGSFSQLVAFVQKIRESGAEPDFNNCGNRPSALVIASKSNFDKKEKILWLADCIGEEGLKEAASQPHGGVYPGFPVYIAQCLGDYLAQNPSEDVEGSPMFKLFEKSYRIIESDRVKKSIYLLPILKNLCSSGRGDSPTSRFIAGLKVKWEYFHRAGKEYCGRRSDLLEQLKELKLRS